MKKSIVLLSLAVVGSTFGQITFEHQYENFDARRIVFESAGEKYVSLDVTNRQINMHNVDHSLWKTIDLIVPENADLVEFYDVSDTKINTDALIEFGYSYTYFNGSELVSECRIMNEDNEILYTIEDQLYFWLSEIEGLETKIISYHPNDFINLNSKVFSLPDFSLEHEYENGVVRRVNLENSGEKYYVYDQVSQDILFYNIDHSIWKTVHLQLLPGADLPSIWHVSENKINSDTNIEIGYGYYFLTNGNYSSICKIVNEFEEDLFTMSGTSYFTIDEMVGLPSKIITYASQGSSSKVYSLPDFNLEYTCFGNYLSRRFQLENSGIKYHYVSISDQSVEILNSDFTHWKSVGLPGLNSLQYIVGGDLDQVLITQNIVNEDDDLEVAYSSMSIENGEIVYEGKMINEGGDELATFPNATKIKLSDIDNCETKLIVYNEVHENNETFYARDIYGLTTTNKLTNLEVEQNVVTVYPNPTSSFFIINNIDFDQLYVYDIDGKEVMKLSKTIPQKIDISSLTNGIYFVECSENNQIVGRANIIVSK